jgi:general secretion pathway protein M
MEKALPDGPRGQILALTLTLLLVAALWFGVAAPLIDWYNDRNEELTQRHALLLHMQQAAETLPTLERALPADTRPVAADLLSGATDALAAAAMQSAAQSKAASAGVNLSSMETLPAETRGAYRRIGLRISLVAPWPVLIELLRAVGDGQPRMLIDELQLRAAPTQEHSAVTPVTASFTLLAFRSAPDGGKP